MGRLSFIVPTFNRPAKTVRCVESILGQQAGHAVEVVVVDDGSTDDTIRRLDRYRSDGRVRVVRHATNRGVTAAKNTGVRASRGDHVAFLDSDDQLAPSGLLHMLELLQHEGPTHLLFCGTVRPDGTPQSPAAAAMPSGDLDYERVLKVWAPVAEFLPVCRRDLIAAIPYDEDLRGFEGLTWLRVIKRVGGLRIDHSPMRIYDDSGADRLCQRHNIIARARSLMLGSERMLAEFGDDLRRLQPRFYDQLVVRRALYARLAGVRCRARHARGSPSLRAHIRETCIMASPSPLIRYLYRRLPAR